ncbi:MAG: XisI protein [Saprospiraceae bacterium]|nr:XisI protein [Saprospiraceae bacterium]
MFRLVEAELVQRGVAREDIILGFEPAFVRPYSGFAVG